jgi:hypothetical protein
MLEAYTLDALNLLATCLHQVEQGQAAFYRVAALELRLLLCDTTRVHNRSVDTALLKRLYPELALHPLSAQGFDLDAVPILLDDWLEQRIPDLPELTIREIIRLVCDQDGGAHVDLRLAARERNWTPIRQWVLKLSRYLVDDLLLIMKP